MSGFDDNKDMGDALQDITNGVNGNSDAPTGPPRNEEAAKLARERGWVEPENYDYTAAAAPTTTAVAVEGDGLVTVADGTWAHSAAKYEWQESFGDIGPENPALEEQLFRSETITRQGVKFDQ